jgi:hypothetical protein
VFEAVNPPSTYCGSTQAMNALADSPNIAMVVALVESVLRLLPIVGVVVGLCACLCACVFRSSPSSLMEHINSGPVTTDSVRAVCHC